MRLLIVEIMQKIIDAAIPPLLENGEFMPFKCQECGHWHTMDLRSWLVCLTDSYQRVCIACLPRRLGRTLTNIASYIK